MKHIPETAQDIWPYDDRNPLALTSVGGLSFTEAPRIVHTSKGRGELVIVIQLDLDRQAALTVDWDQPLSVIPLPTEVHR